MILTLKELATHLRVNERTILRMQKSGQIKGIKIGGQWRFNGSQIDSLFFPERPVEGSEAAVPLAEFSRLPVATPISRIIRAERTLLDLQASDGFEAINLLVEVIAKQNLCLEPGELRDAIHARENLLSTGIGNGIALPHPRDPVGALAVPALIVVGRTRQPLEFAAVDNQPVNLFFLLVSQTIQTHLSMLGQLAHILSHHQAVHGMKTATTYDDFLRELLTAERSEFLSPN